MCALACHVDWERNRKKKGIRKKEKKNLAPDGRSDVPRKKEGEEEEESMPGNPNGRVREAV